MMAPAILKPLAFIDGGERSEFPIGSVCNVVRPEVALVDDPHRLGLVLAALEDRRRRFRPGVAVLLGGRVRVVSVRVVEGGAR
jgi:hypothetical protein